MSRLELLREDQVAGAFRGARRRSKSAVVAVPFWGKGAIKTLGLAAGAKVRVVCNLDHLGCNPDVIEELRDLGIRVKTHPRLHAKLYATADLAIVGSSNVSSNGLAVEGSAARSWIEANVLSDAIDFVSDALSLFETVWESGETRTVSASDIKAARERRARLPLAGFNLAPKQALFEAVQAQPDAFASVYVAAYDEALSKEAQKLLNRVKASATMSDLPSEAVDSGLAVSDFRNFWGYQLGGLTKDDWLINLDCKGRNGPQVRRTAQSTGFRLPVVDGQESEPDLVLAQPRQIEVGGRKFAISSTEKNALVQSARGILRKANGRILPLIDAIKIIDKSS